MNFFEKKLTFLALTPIKVQIVDKSVLTRS